MVCLHQVLAQRLWAKFFKDVKTVVVGLESFAAEVVLEDEFPTTFKEYNERINSLVDIIDHRCPLSLFSGQSYGPIGALAEALNVTHVALRLQRDAIWQGVVKQVSDSALREIFSIAQQEFTHCSKLLKKSLSDMMEQLMDEGANVQLEDTEATLTTERNLPDVDE